MNTSVKNILNAVNSISLNFVYFLETGGHIFGDKSLHDTNGTNIVYFSQCFYLNQYTAHGGFLNLSSVDLESNALTTELYPTLIDYLRK